MSKEEQLQECEELIKLAQSPLMKGFWLKVKEKIQLNNEKNS